jgi:transcriptional regulator with XRE-family HTH domain
MATEENGSPRSANALDRRIGARIRARRLELHMAQTALAEAIGITFQQVQKYEKGTNRVAASVLFVIARTLKLPISAFYGAPEKDTATSAIDSPEFEALVTRYAGLSERGRRYLLAAADAFRRLEDAGEDPDAKRRS